MSFKNMIQDVEVLNAPFRIHKSFIVSKTFKTFGCCIHGKINSIMQKTGVETKSSLLDLNNLKNLRHMSLVQKMSMYEAYAKHYSLMCVRSLMARHPNRVITDIVFVSCTGVVAPLVPDYIKHELDILDCCTYNVGHMGCHGGVKGLKLAFDIAKREDGKRTVLLVACEICTIHASTCSMFSSKDRNAKVMSNFLFGDGVAAVIVSSNEDTGLARYLNYKSIMLKDTAEMLSWRVGDDKFEMYIDKKIPNAIFENIHYIKEFIESISDVSNFHFVVHPGSAKILKFVAEGLGISDNDLKSSYEILATHANMSSTSVFYVLHRLLSTVEISRPYVAIFSVGPGISFECCVVRNCFTKQVSLGRSNDADGGIVRHLDDEFNRCLDLERGDFSPVSSYFTPEDQVVEHQGLDRLSRLLLWTGGFRHLLSLMPRSGKIVEYGCGTGCLSHYVARRLPNANVIGYDIVPSVIRRATTMFGKDCNNLEYTCVRPGGPADCVFCNLFMHHITHPARFIAELIERHDSSDIVIVDLLRCTFNRAFSRVFLPILGRRPFTTDGYLSIEKSQTEAEWIEMLTETLKLEPCQYTIRHITFGRILIHICPSKRPWSVYMGEKRSPYVNELFSEVHNTYEIATRTLSFFQDHAWKTRLIAPLHRQIMSVKAGMVVGDLACGTGDITSMLHPDGVDLYENVYAIDINEDMMHIMQHKLKDIRIEYILKSCDERYVEPERIDHSFASYCFRNLPSWKKGLHCAYESLCDGGVIHVLDMFRPVLFPNCRLRMMRWWCAINDAFLNKCNPVYAYIPHSVENFASRDEFVTFAKEIGFVCVEQTDLFFGFASIVRLQKPTNRFTMLSVTT